MGIGRSEDDEYARMNELPSANEYTDSKDSADIDCDNAINVGVWTTQGLAASERNDQEEGGGKRLP